MRTTLAIITIGLLTAVATVAAPTAEDLVLVMTDLSSTWSARCSAEDSLAEFSPEQVLPSLLPHIEKGMPSALVIYNGGGRDFDKKAPVEWQVYYAVSGSWNHQVRSLPIDSGGKLLLQLLKKAEGEIAKRLILRDMQHRWAPEAEDIIASTFKAPAESTAVKTAAAQALILRGTADYQDLLIEYANTGNFADRKGWFGVLSEPWNKERKGIDPRVVKLGFDLILEDRELSPDYIHGAYFLASKMGSYVDQKFQPDSKDSRYQGEGGLTEQYFEDTVTSAIDWWTNNQERIQRALSTHPLPPTE